MVSRSIGLSIPEMMGRAGAVAVAAANDDPQVVIETYDIATFSGQESFSITEVDGVSIKDNLPVLLVLLQDVATAGIGTGLGFDMRFRDAATTTIRTANYYADVWGERPGSNIGSAVRLATGSGVGCVTCVVQNITVDAPTVVQGSSTDSSYGQLWGMYPGLSGGAVEKHDALVFRASSDASTNSWTSGTLTIIGFKYPGNGVTVKTASLDNAATVQITAPNNFTGWASMVAHRYQRDAATGRPQLRMGVDGVFEAASGDYANDWHRDGDTSQGSITNTEMVAGTIDHDFTSASVLNVWNIGANAPCNFYGRTIGDTAVDPGASERYFGMTRSQFSINDFLYGNISGGADFAPGSGTFYAVFYKHRIDVTAVDLEGLSTWEASQVSELIHYVVTDYDTNSAAISAQHGDGTYVTSGYREHLNRSGVVAVNSQVETDVTNAVGFTAAQGEQFAAGQLWGLKQSYLPLHFTIHSANTFGSSLRWAVGYEWDGAKAVNNEYKNTRASGTWAAGITAYDCRYRTKTV